MPNDEFFTEAKRKASEWACALLERAPATLAILDTETTGLNQWDEVIQIAAIDGAGNVLIDNFLIKPTISIPVSAYLIHHIDDKMVENKRSFPDVFPEIEKILNGKHLVIYNADYDLRILRQSAYAANFSFDLNSITYSCAMQMYAQWYGVWNDYYGSFRWQKLQGGDHSALGDCFATLNIIKKMAAR